MGATVLFDGVCNFCDNSVNFIIEHDREGYFRFAPLQSDAGRELAAKIGFIPAGRAGERDDELIPIDSVILLEDGKAYTHSTAALRILKRLGRPWSWLYALIVVPKAVRDLVYKLFAKYRYRFFGKRDQCMIPTPAVRARFLA